MKTQLMVVAALGFAVVSGAALAGDAAAGKGKYAVCGGCHGPTGAGNEALKYPALVGQSAGDIATKLKEYKSGARDNATMKAMVAGLSDADIENVSAYIATFK
jgi:cytochrome c553